MTSPGSSLCHNEKTSHDCGHHKWQFCDLNVQWKLDLADTDLAENLDLKDTLQKIWATIFYFYYIIPLELAENLDLADKSLVTDFSAKSSFHCNYKINS